MTVELNIRENLAEITLKNPAKSNVLDAPVSEALKNCVAKAEVDPNVNCIIIAAEGKTFCAGGSLDELIDAQHNDPAVLNDIYAGFLAVANSPLPTIAAVQGAAVGAGMNLVLACDLRVVTEYAKFDTRFMQLGIHCGGGHSWMLQKFMNWEQSVAALVFGEVITGDQAVAKGLAYACVASDELLEESRRLAASLKMIPRELVEQTKASLSQSRSEISHQVMVEHEYQVQANSLKQPHAIQRLQYFKHLISGKK